MESERPFYHQFAWAYELLIDRPVAAECGGIVQALTRRGVAAGGRVLDAGCGTGRYARELANLGYVVLGIDQSPEMIAEAQLSSVGVAGSVTFTVGDILALPPTRRFDAVLCRGVLNDLLDPEDRKRAFERLAGALRVGGVLLLDVRDWNASTDRKGREPVFEKTIETPRGRLTFRSVTRLDPPNAQLLVSEHHSLVIAGDETTADYDFAMKCWTREELEAHLRAAGFRSTEFSARYTPSTPAGGFDRLVVTASL